MLNTIINDILYMAPYGTGVFYIKKRDTSYWNYDNGPNREDGFSMFWNNEYGDCYSIGSHPSFDGAKTFIENDFQNYFLPKLKYFTLIED